MGFYNVGHQVLLAKGAGLSLWGAFWIGLLKVLPIIIVTYAVGGFWEVLFSIIRKHEVNEGFLVTGILYALTLPPTIPLWQVAVGISFGVVIGKEIFGGTGYNVLNPALTARAFVFFAYPAQMSGDAVWAAVDGFSESGERPRRPGASPCSIEPAVPARPGELLHGTAGCTLLS